MQIVLDIQFYSVYVLKVISYAFLNISLSLAQRLFSELYMKRVYAQQTTPPNLQGLLMLVFFVHAAFNLILFLVLGILYLTFNRKDTTFVVNSYLIHAYFLDYVLNIGVLWMIMAIIVGIVQSKKYFRYRTEGLRAIRAVTSITRLIALVVGVFPLGYIIL